MNNLLNLQQLTNDQVKGLIKEALEFKIGTKEVDYNFKKIIGLLFFESSTRTHYSFDVAAKRLGVQTINFSPNTSSLNKGETFKDTIRTFESFGIDGLVIRSEINEYYKQLEDVHIPIINGGDGSGSHPTQALLDLVTIYEHFGKFSGLKVLIIGDIKHSRVARSNYEIMKRLDMDVKFVADPDLKDNYGEYVDIDDEISNVDILMLLRVQLERHEDEYATQAYNKQYGLNISRLEKLSKEAIILHPAPFNLGVELTEDVLEDDRCKIFEQSKNGVFLRMAVINNVL